MRLDPTLRARLVCPRCRGELDHREQDGEERLICTTEGLAWPVVEGVPWLVPEAVRRLPAEGR